MQDILREIFDNFYEGKIENHPMTEAERAVWDRARGALGEEFTDGMMYAQSRVLHEGQYDAFRLGFRLGAMMVLELYST